MFEPFELNRVVQLDSEKNSVLIIKCMKRCPFRTFFVTTCSMFSVLMRAYKLHAREDGLMYFAYVFKNNKKMTKSYSSEKGISTYAFEREEVVKKRLRFTFVKRLKMWKHILS